MRNWFILGLLLSAQFMAAQVIRWDVPVWTVNTSVPSAKALYPMLAFPYTPVKICTTWTASGCTALATTYTDSTGGTPCPSTAQLTPANGSGCSANTDIAGGAGAWIGAGSYAYFVTSTYGTFGPYIISVGSGAANISNQAVGVLPLPTGTNSIGAQSHLDDGVTAAGTITSSEPFAAAAVNGVYSVDTYGVNGALTQIGASPGFATSHPATTTYALTGSVALTNGQSLGGASQCPPPVFGTFTPCGSIYQYPVGGAASTAVEQLNGTGITLQNHTVDCNSVSGCIAAQYFGTNTTSSAAGNIQNWSAIGFHWGFVAGDASLTPSTTNREADTLGMQNFRLYGNFTGCPGSCNDTTGIGVVINSGNALNQSELSRGVISNVNVGIECVRQNEGLQLSRLASGTPQGTNTTFLRLDGGCYPSLISGNEVEGKWQNPFIDNNSDLPSATTILMGNSWNTSCTVGSSGTCTGTAPNLQINGNDKVTVIGDQGANLVAGTVNTGGSGTVNASGTAVSWASGTTFNTSWPPYMYVLINGTAYQLASSPSSSTSMTLLTSAGTLTGATYVVDTASVVAIQSPLFSPTTSNVTSINGNGSTFGGYARTRFGFLQSGTALPGSIQQGDLSLARNSDANGDTGLLWWGANGDYEIHTAGNQSFHLTGTTNGAEAGLQVYPALAAGLTPTFTYGFQVHDLTLGAGASAASYYGIYIPALSAATNPYGIYNLAKEYTAGLLQTGSHRAQYASGPSASAGTVTGTDEDGYISGLSGATTVTITFNLAWGTIYGCVASTSQASTPVQIASIGNSAATFNFASLTGTLYYHCGGK